MKQKFSILYFWIVKIATMILPDIPVFMRFRGWLYSLMMAECGTNFQVTASAVLNPLTGMRVGHDVYIAHHSVLIGENISIGDAVLIGPNCILSSSNHSYHDSSFRFGPRVQGTVHIGNGSWIAGNCSLVSGASIPDKCILAAGSVLTKKMTAPNTLYGGVPAKKIKTLDLRNKAN